MKGLYVVGSCLSKNTSANMSHNGYVQGLLENGCQVDILMAKTSWGQTDRLLPQWHQARYYCYASEALHDRIRKRVGRSVVHAPVVNKDVPTRDASTSSILRSNLRGYLKKAYYLLFPADPIYPLEKRWLKSASEFRSDMEYDLVVSNSSPAASHKLVDILAHRGHLKYKRWIQIWEDPWYFDLYGRQKKEIFDEEASLLTAADEVYYVSPLTLLYQQRYFKDNAYKMKQIPLPYLSFSSGAEAIREDISFAYLGDYYSHVRNLMPFYLALSQTRFCGYIYGDSDVVLEGTDKIEVSGRVTLDRLASVQEKSSVLVQLCNLRGGQIPGKIYHYSATRKPILFILDGTSEEKEQIEKYFRKFNRYYFCDNNVQSIISAINRINVDIVHGERWYPVTAFSPKNVVTQML